MYQILNSGGVLRVSDGANIPADPANADFAAFLGYVAGGGAPIPCALDERRADAWERIKAERDRRTTQGGYRVNVGGVDKWFHSDVFSRTQQLGLVLAGANVPAAQWKTMDGTFVPMTQQLAGQIFAAAAASDVALFEHAKTLRAQVDAAQDPAAIDITAGWPTVFGG